MSYLIGEIIVCLLIAFLLGLVIGWLLKRLSCAREVAGLQAELAQLSAARAPASAAAETLEPAPAATAAALSAVAGAGLEDAASYDIEAIEGIGPGYGKRLRGMAIGDTEALLARGCDREGLAAVAEQVGIEQFVVAKWVCMADLMRVSGVGGQEAELLAWAGVESVQDLATRKPETLARALANTNAKENRVAEPPASAAVSAWVQTAASLTKKLPG